MFAWWEFWLSSRISETAVYRIHVCVCGICKSFLYAEVLTSLVDNYLYRFAASEGGNANCTWVSPHFRISASLKTIQAKLGQLGKIHFSLAG